MKSGFMPGTITPGRLASTEWTAMPFAGRWTGEPKCSPSLLGHPPTCSAVPGWKCNDLVLEEKARFVFRYNSDCRGDSIFRPVVEGRELPQPQVPVTLPTYDEVIGRNGVSNDNYNEYLLGLLRPGKLNVLTIHAEVEGIVCLHMFEQFVEKALSLGH